MMSAMKIELRHLSEERTRHGRVVLYARIGGRRKRMLHAPGSAEFLEEYRAAIVSLRTGTPDPVARSGRERVQIVKSNEFAIECRTLGRCVSMDFSNGCRTLNEHHHHSHSHVSCDALGAGFHPPLGRQPIHFCTGHRFRLYRGGVTGLGLEA